MQDEQIEQKHLDLLRQRREEVAQKAGAAPDFTKREAIWSLDVVDPTTGERLQGTFRSRAPSLRQQDEIGLLVASLASGLPWDTIPPRTRLNLTMHAYLTVCLADRPEWFKDPAGFFTEDVPAAVYTRLQEHLSTFFRPGPRAGAGGATDGAQPALAPAVAGGADAPAGARRG